jgi:hypothetical protein
MRGIQRVLASLDVEGPSYQKWRQDHSVALMNGLDVPGVLIFFHSKYLD